MLLQGQFRGNDYGPHMAQYYKTVASSPAMQAMQAPVMQQKIHAHVPVPSAPPVFESSKRLGDKEACNDPEEACDEDKFGEENKGPEKSECWKPVLPAALSVSTFLGGVAVSLVQIPMLTELTGWPFAVLFGIAVAIYGVTLLCMLWVARADPGQVNDNVEGELPKRTHKSWLYPKPVRRYDHYCRWLQNVVGLLNHREFMVMLIGLTLIATLGVLIDPYLVVLAYERAGIQIIRDVVLLLHWVYSLILLFYEGKIFMIHVGLISRNETAQEWKLNKHYVVHNTSKGDNVPVESLSDSDEYNEFFDKGAFTYSPQANSLDKGCPTNCFNFWCEPRWPAAVKGDF